MVTEAASASFFWSDLPEACIAHVLSFTSPRDACRLSLVSPSFCSAADSDGLWDSFIPPDCPSMPLSLSSKKHLYLSLSDEPLLVDDGRKSFWLDKPSGKKCYMLSARSLSIVWGGTPMYWTWTSVPESRFEEVAELVSVCWVEIQGRIHTRMLSPSTLYAAYLVMKLTDDAYGFEGKPVEVSIGIAGNDSDHQKRTVYLDAESMVGIETGNLELQYPSERADGWLEIELGDFFNEGRDDKELEMAVWQTKYGNWKCGLIIEGFEIRPKLNQ